MLALLNGKNEQTAIPLLGTNLLVATLFCIAVRSYKGGLLQCLEREFVTDYLVAKGSSEVCTSR
jgi:hypothetical protein